MATPPFNLDTRYGMAIDSRILQLFLGLLLALFAVLAHGQAGTGGESASASDYPGVVWQSPISGRAIENIGPGDSLQLTVYGHPELSAPVTVSHEGTITIPFIGTAYVEGLSPTEIARLVEKGLEDGGYIRQPRASVEVLKVRSNVASVLGEVQRPGRYAIEGHMTLLELLALAGGTPRGR